ASLTEPVASRHPSSREEGSSKSLPSSSRRAGRDSVADGWSGGTQTHTTPSLRATPPRERRGICLILPSWSRRARRDGVAEGWSGGRKNIHRLAARTIPPLRIAL